MILDCGSCGAALNVEEHHHTTTCPYCTSPAVVQRPTASPEAEPTFVLGFVVHQERALEQARRWVRSAWFTPTAFRKSDPSLTRGIYVPAYLYTAAAKATYSASIGENYTVTETYTDSQGKTRTRTKTKTEWRELSGSWAAYVDDVLVTASKGLGNRELEVVEPFDLRALRRYSAKLLSGWVAENPSLPEEQCVAQGRAEANVAVGRRLAAHMPGNKHRNLTYQSTFHNEDVELLLLPVWVLAIQYDDDKPPTRLLINGQTGEIAGKPPRSWVKIVSLVLGVLAAIAAIYIVGSLT